MTKEFNEQSFEQDVLQEEKVVLVDFWAPWCGPCRQLAPVIDALAKDLEGDIVVGKVNIDENTALATRYEIMTIPTLILFKNGEILDRQVGRATKEHLSSWISEKNTA